MAQLIYMRQRIKAVETIKKITHAMRLVAMSTHSRLRAKKAHLESYKNAFQTLWIRVKQACPAQKTEEKTQASLLHLFILVGSQKGLCGTFNSHLFKYFHKEHPIIKPTDHFISVGKYATDFLKDNTITPLATYSEFSSHNFVSIAHAITAIIMQSPDQYSHVTLYSNYPISFFIQKPQKTALLPLKDISLDQSLEKPLTDPQEYIFETNPIDLSMRIQHLMLSITLHELLFESLLAEQAARFISMDTSTRNADKLLNTMRLEYNKTRQAAITRELTELATNY